MHEQLGTAVLVYNNPQIKEACTMISTQNSSCIKTCRAQS